MATSIGGKVAQVQPGSAASAAGVRAGDVILSVNGHALHDVLDYQLYSAEENIELLIQRGNGASVTLRLRREYGQPLGIAFEHVTFDGIRRCHNRCEFCFIRHMPPGLRKTLYVRDDDYRYSFLYGNFVTLTNLSTEDWARIKEQHLSPLYVSVHSTDPALRARMLGTPDGGDILRQLRRLGRAGIDLHTQIVVVPTLNDGLALERSVRDLARLPTVRSIGIVPVGLTHYRSRGLRTLTGGEARSIVAYVGSLQPTFRAERGVGLVYASDELYLMAEQPLPSGRAYDGFPQLANGIGLTRQLLDEWRGVKRRGPATAFSARSMTWACGALIAPTLEDLAAQFTSLVGTEARVAPVSNQFFGQTVTVSGLLTARDVIAALRGRALGELVVLPRSMFDAAGEVTLDDLRLSDIQQALGVRVTMAERLGEILCM